MTERFDHRTDEARIQDAGEEEVIEQPVQQGAADLRREVAEAEQHGDIENDPTGPPSSHEAGDNDASDGDTGPPRPEPS
jgi:hypothetical protein